jgi:FkbM family methyltransferase
VLWPPTRSPTEGTVRANGHRIGVQGTYLDWYCELFGTFEPHVRSAIAATLRPGGTAVDVGANVGLHTLTMASAVGPEGSVLAIEPNPVAVARLRANLALNDLDARVLVHAVSDRVGEMPLFVPDGVNNNLGQARLGPRDGLTAGGSVAVTTLDLVAERLDALDLLKIDVEGFEVAVLRGARRTLERFRPVVLLEYEPELWLDAGHRWDDLVDLLADVGPADLSALRLRGRPAPIRQAPSHAVDVAVRFHPR